jgi:hypothetical protein
MKELAKSSITLKESIETKRETFKVECKSSLMSESVKKVIFLSANPYLTLTECDDTGVKNVGKVNFFVCYEDENGDVRKTECILDFEKAIKMEETEKAFATIKLEKVEFDLSGLSLNLFATLELLITVSKRVEKQFISGGEDFFCENKEFSHLRSLGEKSTVFSIEEEFELPYTPLEVLYQKAVPSILSCHAGVGVIVVDGEVNISQILLQKDGKRDIIKESKTFPFTAEIECDEAMPSDFAVATVFEKSFKTDVTADEEQNKAVVNCSILLSLSGEAFTIEETPIIVDAFSIDNELELVKEEVVTLKNKEQYFLTENISGKVEFDELPVGSTLLLTTNEKVEITSSNVEKKGILVSGVLVALSIFRNGEGKLFSRKMETPFEKLLPLAIKENYIYEVFARAKNANNKIISLTTGELFMEICFSIIGTEKERVNLLTDIKCVKEKTPIDSAISVYIPLAGETLFPLAKRLNVNPDHLVLTNKELQFPLSGEERIVIYRQK